MTADELWSRSTKLLTPGALQFVFNRALRSRAVLSLVTVEVQKLAAVADERIITQVGDLMENVMREHDPFGYLDARTLALLLMNSDYALATRVGDRLLAGLEGHLFPTAITVTIGAASYPTHAMGASSLRRWALSHPIATCRFGAPSFAG